MRVPLKGVGVHRCRCFIRRRALSTAKGGCPFRFAEGVLTNEHCSGSSAAPFRRAWRLRIRSLPACKPAQASGISRGLLRSVAPIAISPPCGGPPAPGKRAYPAPAPVPTQQGAKGIQFDFNDGCRVFMPDGDNPWRVRLSDLDTGNILFETELKAGHRQQHETLLRALSSGSLAEARKHLRVHEYSAADRDILIQFPVGTLGDTLGWFPYAVKFKERHGCRLTCGMADKLIPLFRRCISGYHLCHPRKDQAGAVLRHLQYGTFLRRQRFCVSTIGFSSRRAAPHSRLYSRRRSD